MDGLKWTPLWALVVLVANAGTAACSDDGGGGSAAMGGSGTSGASGVAGLPAGGAATAGSTGNQAGTNTAGTSAGVAGSTAGGSGTGPRGAVALNVATGSDCKLPIGAFDIPAVTGGHPVNAADATNPIADNTSTPEGLVRVTCEMQGGIAHGTIRNEKTGQSVEVSSGFPTTTPELTGILARLVLDQTNYGASQANLCPMTLVKSTSTSFLVKVSCPTFAPVDGSAGKCVLNESYAYFDGCTN